MKKLLAVLAAGTILSSGFYLPGFAASPLVAARPIQVNSQVDAIQVNSGQSNSVWQNQLRRQRVTKRRVVRRSANRVKTRPATRRVQKRTGIFALFGAPQQKRRVTRPAQNRVASRRNQNQVRSGVVDLSGPMTPQRVNRMVASQKREAAKQRPIDPQWLPRTVNYETSQKKGTIIIDTNTRHLYLVLGNGKARRYGVGVGKTGFEWSGTHKISRKREWPSWRPPQEMIARERAKGRILPEYMEGGQANPLGARALYIGSTLYRIHGTNQPWSIGQAVSSGCIRMRNEDVMDLYERVGVGAKVIVS